MISWKQISPREFTIAWSSILKTRLATSRLRKCESERFSRRRKRGTNNLAETGFEEVYTKGLFIWVRQSGWLGYRDESEGRILWCVHMENFSPVDRDEFKKHKHNQHILVIALSTLVTLLIKLIHILLKWKNIQDQYYTILAAMLWKAILFKSFVPITRLLIWTHRYFYKEKSGEARSRKPSQSGWLGSYEEALKDQTIEISPVI